LLKLGDQVFRELTARSVPTLHRRTGEVRDITGKVWSESDSRRQDHELALNPKLANPNNEKDLISLVEREADRFDAALQTAGEDWTRMVECLRAEGDIYVRRLAARFEVAIALLDALPLHSHFAPLPGDEQVEAPRMSIKRRMRRMQNGQDVDAEGDGLPERQWNGLPRRELRCLLRAGAWPEDPELPPDTATEVLEETTPGAASYRSPVHRQLYDRRNAAYEAFKTAFQTEVERRSKDLETRQEKEKVGDRTWTSMARQLNPDAVDESLGARNRAKEEAAAAVVAAAAEAAEAADPKKGGKKK